MEKKLFRQKVLAVGIVVVMLLVAVGMSGCRNMQEFIHTDDWIIFRDVFNPSQRYALVELKNPDLVIDGILTIPTEVDGMTIRKFGVPDGLYRSQRFFNPGEGVEKIIIPSGITVDVLFWGSRNNSSSVVGRQVRYVEFRSETFDQISLGYNVRHITFIIPDGSLNNLLYRLKELPLNIEDYTFFEISEWIMHRSVNQ